MLTEYDRKSGLSVNCLTRSLSTPIYAYLSATFTYNAVLPIASVIETLRSFEQLPEAIKLTRVSATSEFEIAIKFLVPFSYSRFIGDEVAPKSILSSIEASCSLISLTPSEAITDMVLAISHCA